MPSLLSKPRVATVKDKLQFEPQSLSKVLILDQEIPLDLLQYLGGISIDIGNCEYAALQLHLTRHGNRFYGRGSATAAFVAVCSRCAESFTHTVQANLNVWIVPQANDELTDDVLTYTYTPQCLDIGALVREQLALELPLRVWCTASCRGLCRQCGYNFNQGCCQCRTALSSLKGFANGCS